MNEDAPTRHANKQCAEWLVACLALGWRRDQLDDLEALWWKHHDRCGVLRGPWAREEAR